MDMEILEHGELHLGKLEHEDASSKLHLDQSQQYGTTPQAPSAHDDSSPDEKKFKPKGNNYRPQHFRQAWREQFPWVTSVVGKTRRAYCLTCQAEVTSELSVLKRHEKSARHLRSSAKNTLPPQQVYDPAEKKISNLVNKQIVHKKVSVKYRTQKGVRGTPKKRNQEEMEVCVMIPAEFVNNAEDVLDKYIPEPELGEVKRIFYGCSATAVDLPHEALAIGDHQNFEIKAYCFEAFQEELTPPRLVRVGLIQNQIVLQTTDPLVNQRNEIHSRICTMVEAAFLCGVNILCLQETWTMPFAFGMTDKLHWCEFAEDANTGPTTLLCQELAIKYNMVIISPILERDEIHNNTLWNSAIVISNSGLVLGKSRKNHIPRVGEFNESAYYMEGNTGHPVFQTQFGKIAVNLSYGRHHPQNWLMYGLNGAEIVFNPTASAGPLCEPMWAVEARNAAIANSYFTCAINRVGTEFFPAEYPQTSDGQVPHKEFGHFYGSSYVAAPDGSRTPSLSRVRDGLLVVEMDLKLCRQAKDRLGFGMTQRLELYTESLKKFQDPNYQPPVIRDPNV